ncbi:hypothetical protein, partial [Bradyrhizobium sp. Leo170]|uniref:hypothetical protein n=1 Tax=Bradyrhizobium sp. Leo170 TaxID=1571199 RepID=UPI0010D156F0
FWIDGDWRLGGVIIQQSGNFSWGELLWIKRESLWLYGERRLSGLVIWPFLNLHEKLMFQPLKFQWIGWRLRGLITEHVPNLRVE